MYGLEVDRLSQWEEAEIFAADFTVWGWAAIPKFRNDVSPCSEMPNCCNVPDKVTWKELAFCDCP